MKTSTLPYNWQLSKAINELIQRMGLDTLCQMLASNNFEKTFCPLDFFQIIIVENNITVKQNVLKFENENQLIPDQPNFFRMCREIFSLLEGTVSKQDELCFYRKHSTGEYPYPDVVVKKVEEILDNTAFKKAFIPLCASFRCASLDRQSLAESLIQAINGLEFNATIGKDFQIQI